MDERKSTKTERGAVTVAIVMMGITTILALLCCGYLLYEQVKRENMQEEVAPEITYTESQVEIMLAEVIRDTTQSVQETTTNELRDGIREMMTKEKGAILALRYYYPEYMVFNDPDGLNFIPILDTLAHNDLDQGEFVLDEKAQITYYRQGEVASHKGIDVSKFQESIDWDRVAADGVEFAFLRVGFRGWGETGTMNLDTSFADNAEGANAAGIKVGAYFYSTAITEEEIHEEVDFILEQLEGHTIDYPVVIDVEKADGGVGRADGLTKEERTKLILVFCERIQEAGYTPMIYANTSYLLKGMDLALLQDYDIWFARFDTQFYYPYEIAIWQYSNKGTVDGIEGVVDLNISFKEW